MPRAKSPRASKSKADKNVLQMPQNGNGHSLYTPQDLEAEIRLRAYTLYEQRGKTPGAEQEDWLLAEREVLARYANQTHTA